MDVAKLIIFVTLITLILSCSNEKEKLQIGAQVLSNLNDVQVSTWNKLSDKNIYFGHQSIGHNILEGIEDILSGQPQIKLNIVETTDPKDFKGGIFAHSKIGKNMNPESKIDEFEKILENGVGDKVDIAILKFCAVDINPPTDVEIVFNAYKSAFSRLKMKYPDTVFIHVTVPLTSDGVGIRYLIKKTKDIVKNIVGKTNFYNNDKRNIFNEMLLNEYSGKEPIFDLAELQSTYPDGTRSTYEKDGKTYYSLVADYTYPRDALHLNEYSRRITAERMLILLTEYAR